MCARPRAAGFLLAVLVLAPPLLSAQAKPRVLLDALVGFNGVAREGRFAPLVVSVATPGTRLSADVRVDVVSGSILGGTKESRSFVHADTFAAGGLRRLPFVFPFPVDARSLVVTVNTQGAEVARTVVDLRSAATSDRLIAGISSTLALDSLSALPADGRTARVVYPRVDDLPESWGGYDGVDLVVVHDTYFRQLRAAQVAALQRWVVAGGTVVFTGGVAALQHESAGLGSLLPVAVTGITERGALPEISALAGHAAAPRGRITVAQSTVRSGTVLAAQDGLPLVVKRPLGLGTVWFLAVDPTLPPFTGWPGTLLLWRTMAGSGGRQPALSTGARQPEEDTWMAVLLSAPSLAFPPLTVVLLFGAVYVGLLVAGTLGSRGPKARGRLRGVALVVTPLAACAAAWFLFNRALFQPVPLLLEASVAQVRSGDGLAVVTEKVGIFATRPVVIDLSFLPPDVLMEEIAPFAALSRRADQEPAALTVAAAQRTAVQGMAVGRYGSRLIAASGVVPMPVAFTVSGDESSALVTVVNDSALWLRGSFVWRKGRAWPLGDIAPGSTVARAISSDDGVDLRSGDGLKRLHGSDHRVSFWNLLTPDLDGTAPVLVAWLDEPALRSTVNGARRPPGIPGLSLLIVEQS